jgi:hypothetical protein
MKTIEVYICDRCDKMIMPSRNPNPPNGFVVEGNIYVAEQGEGGLVGNNFPKEGEEMRRGEIRKMCLCKDCFLEVLHLAPEKKEVDPWDGDGLPALYH